MPAELGDAILVEPSRLGALIDLLRDEGHEVLGPTMDDGSIVLDEITCIEDLPRGWTDEQAPGSYRTHRRNDEALFGYVVGPHSAKGWFYPASFRLWAGRRTVEGFAVEPASLETHPPKRALIGLRPCDLAALEIQDRVLDGPERSDPWYRESRKNSFLVVVQCTQSADTCFCASMGTGPRAEKGYDIALTELLEEDRHEILCEAGSERGLEVIEKLEGRLATEEDCDRARRIAAKVAGEMKAHVETEGLPEHLARSWEHPRWDEVARRCYGCGNCTMVCPTCFCMTVEDVNDLTGDRTERWRHWDSCHGADHSYVHGGNVRAGTRSRYRQWLQHKFNTWHAQFGTSGCTGCGRCVTWCPAGIDVTEELAAIRASNAPQPTPTRSQT